MATPKEGMKQATWNSEPMATLEQFKRVRASVAPEVQTELYGLLVQDLDAAVQKMIETCGDCLNH